MEPLNNQREVIDLVNFWTYSMEIRYSRVPNKRAARLFDFD